VPDQLVVITGAGASKDATRSYPSEESWRPPLVTELFSERPGFTSILGQYPDAQTLAPDLRATVQSGSVGLETYLRDHVLNAASDYDRRRYRSIPLYLQHVLLQVSENFTPHPTNYDRLINASLRSAREVLFITLNYDTLLDKRLSHHTQITSLGGYVNSQTPWKLFKLHGSVNWVRQIAPGADLDGPNALLSNVAAQITPNILSEQIVFSTRTDVEAMRHPEADEFYYPALSVPLGPDDEMNCPAGHLALLRERLQAHDGLHVLTVGYSGLDSGLLNLLRESGNSLRSLLAVNHSGESAFDASGRIPQALGAHAITPEMAYPDDFHAFVGGDDLARHLDQL
jgi:hypothetical protein